VNTTELKDYFRTQVRDDVAPYLWSDEELYVYMNEAQRSFVRRTGGIFDITSEATEVSVTENEAYSDLHPSILHIRKALLDDRDLMLVNLADAQSASAQDDFLSSFMPAVSNQPGTVTRMVIGEERNKCRWISIPDADATVRLAIARLPLDDLTADGQELEVAPEHHVPLIDGMMALAYLKQDADTFNPKAAEEGAVRFRAYCDQVWKEWERYRHKPRTVSYGGL
jgi:hypothetical protein